MELIDRYMGAVAQALPPSRRDEIIRELRANVLDSLEAVREAQGRAPTVEEVSGVLTALGHPQLVAASFLPPQQLVTPGLFPLYKQTLHYGFILVFILAVIQFGLGFLGSGAMDFFGLFHGFMTKGLITFAMITGLFYLFSNPPGGKALFKPYQCWAPEKLPPVSRPWQRISSCEQSVDVVSDLFFLALLNYSLWMPPEQLGRLALAFADPVSNWIPLFSTVMLASLLFGAWNMVYRYWTLPKLLIDAVINLASAIILLTLSRADAILVKTTNPQAELVISIDLANHIITIGLFWVGMWLMLMVGRSLYRAWQLSR